MRKKELQFNTIFKPEPEGGFTVTVPSLPGCITYGKTLEEAKKMIVEAIELYLESMRGEKIESDKESLMGLISVKPKIHA